MKIPSSRQTNLLYHISFYLNQKQIPNPKLEAKWMIERLFLNENSSSFNKFISLPVSKIQLTPSLRNLLKLSSSPDLQNSLNRSHDDLYLSVEKCNLLETFLKQRVFQKMPLQYILGDVPFAFISPNPLRTSEALSISIFPPVLIPRPETEQWTLWLAEKIRKYLKHKSPQSQEREKIYVLDMGCGSGCISLSLAKSFTKDLQVIGVDINPKAVELSIHNKNLNDIQNALFYESDLFQFFEENKYQQKKFDIIVSNPPYVSRENWDKLSDEVTQWEDKKAIVGDCRSREEEAQKEDNIFFYRKILSNIQNYLKHPHNKNERYIHEYSLPSIVFEVDEREQCWSEVISLIESDTNYKNIQLHNDYFKKPRWISAEYSPQPFFDHSKE